MDIAGWTATVLGIAAILPAVVSIPKDAAHRRPALIASGVLVLLALGIGAVSLWPRAPLPQPVPVPPTTSPPAPPSSGTAVRTQTDIVPTSPTPVPDDNPRWAGTVRLTSFGLDLDVLPGASTDAGGNDLTLMSGIGSAPSMMVFYRSAVWPSGETPTRQQCAEQLATQPLDQIEALKVPAKNAALCLQTNEENLAFVRVTGITSNKNSPYSGLDAGVVAEARIWQSDA